MNTSEAAERKAASPWEYFLLTFLKKALSSNTCPPETNTEQPPAGLKTAAAEWN